MESTTFWLNDERIETDEHPGLLVLDYVRRHRLTGTKEGCKEGDCGACTVLVGELRAGRVHYEPVTSCLVPLGEMHGKHVVTIEGLNFQDRLSFVQDAMVHCGGTQCGYCTPGFVVSMTWYLMSEDEAEPSLDGFKRSISGNLCRCTGYASINRAGQEIVDALAGGGKYRDVWTADDRLNALVERELIPEYFGEMADRLAAIETPAAEEGTADFLIAGGTDVYVQRGEEIPRATVSILNHHPEMRGIRRTDDGLRLGSLTTFTEFAQDPDVRALIPRMDEFLWLIASLHIRNRATLGGNIVNASPIGDMTSLLLALGSTLVLAEGGRRREVPMKDFFLGYKKLDKTDRELVTEVVVPAGSDRTLVNFEKVSKRKALDIATVCSGARFEVDGDVIEDASISMGGVAPIPLLLEATNDYLTGRAVAADTVRGALSVAQTEVAPISDVRGSEQYKRLLVQQLIIAHFTELFADQIRFEELAS